MPVAGLRFPRLRRGRGARPMFGDSSATGRMARLGWARRGMSWPSNYPARNSTTFSRAAGVSHVTAPIAAALFLSVSISLSVSVSVSALTHVCEGGLTQLLCNPLI